MPQEKKPWAILGCAWLMAFSMYSRVLCFPPIGHIVKEELSLSHSQQGLIFSLPLAMLAICAIPSGLLADRIGTRKAAGIGAIIMAVGSLLTGTATNFATLFLFTCIFGIGFSMIFPNLPKLIGAWFPPEKVNVASGIYVTGVAVGAAVAVTITLPVIFPITNDFRIVFYVWSIPAIVAAILWWIVVKEPPVTPGSPHSEQEGGISKRSHVVWGNKGLWLVAFTLFCLNVIFYTWSGWTPALMMKRGASPESAAFILAILQWAHIPTMFLVPWATEKVGLKKPFLWGSAIGTALVAWGGMYIPVSLGWVLMVVLAPVIGTFPLLLAYPVELVPRESVGTASGMMLSIGYIGGLVGPWLAGYIVDITGTFNTTLIVLIGVGVAMAVIAFLLPETGWRAKLRK